MEVNTHQTSWRLHSRKLSFSACLSSSGLVFWSHFGLKQSIKKKKKNPHELPKQNRITGFNNGSWEKKAEKSEHQIKNFTFSGFVMPFNIHFYSTHLLGIHRNCLFSSWSFLILWFSSKDSSPVLASGGTNLILSFSIHRGEKKVLLFKRRWIHYLEY